MHKISTRDGSQDLKAENDLIMSSSRCSSQVSARDGCTLAVSVDENFRFHGEMAEYTTLWDATDYKTTPSECQLLSIASIALAASWNRLNT
jgi:hypothetical protein